MRNRAKSGLAFVAARAGFTGDSFTAGEKLFDAILNYPFVLSAGERRSETTNTIIRNPDWRKKSRHGALRINPQDAAALGLSDDDQARLRTRRGSAEVTIETTETMRRGHLSLPNGLGLDYDAGDGVTLRVGVSVNELTASEDRDFLAGTPWHKHVPARLERL